MGTMVVEEPEKMQKTGVWCDIEETTTVEMKEQEVWSDTRQVGMEAPPAVETSRAGVPVGVVTGLGLTWNSRKPWQQGYTHVWFQMVGAQLIHGRLRSGQRL